MLIFPVSRLCTAAALSLSCRKIENVFRAVFAASFRSRAGAREFFFTTDAETDGAVCVISKGGAKGAYMTVRVINIAKTGENIECFHRAKIVYIRRDLKTVYEILLSGFEF